MAGIQKTLQGVIRINTDDTYYFNLPSSTISAIPNALANQVLEEVYIIIENVPGESSPTIVLPPISSFKGAWNTKIYVINKKEASIITTPKESEEQIDYINFLGTNSITAKAIAYLHVVDDNLWACWVTPS